MSDLELGPVTLNGAIEQGSLEWHAYREAHANASEAPALMSAGHFEVKTPYQLALLRRGDITIEYNAAMRHGNETEEQARACAARLFDIPIHPILASRLVNGVPLSASCDGVEVGFDGRALTVLEIKSPYSGKKSNYWTHASKGQWDASFRWQCVQQLLATDAERLIFFVYINDKTTAHLEMTREEASEEFAALAEAWVALWPHIQDGTLPSPSETDVVSRADAEWREAAEAFAVACEVCDQATDAKNEAKARLLELAGETGAEGGGVRAVKFFRQGPVDYSQLDIPADPPRKKGAWQWRVSLKKEAA